MRGCHDNCQPPTRPQRLSHCQQTSVNGYLLLSYDMAQLSKLMAPPWADRKKWYEIKFKYLQKKMKIRKNWPSERIALTF